MKKILVGIYDLKAEEYIAVILTQNNATALRQFSQDILNPRSPLAQFPEDYRLDKLADIVVYDGSIKPDFHILTTAKDCVNHIKGSDCEAAEAPEA